MHKAQVVKIVLAAALISSLVLFACAKKNEGGTELRTEMDKVSYIIGSQIGAKQISSLF